MAANTSAVVADLLPPAFISKTYGGPARLRLVLSLPSQAEGLQVSLVIVEKTTTRLPEEGWVEFRPSGLTSSAIIGIEKLGSMVDPADMLVNGSRTLHAVGDEQGVLFTQPSASDSTDSQEVAGAKSLRLISLDAGLVSPGPAAQNMDLYAFPGVLCAFTKEFLSILSR